MKTGDKSMLKGVVLSMEAGKLLATDGCDEEAALGSECSLFSIFLSLRDKCRIYSVNYTSLLFNIEFNLKSKS